MKKLSGWIKLFKALGTIDVAPETLEQALIDVGYDLEHCHRHGVSMHDYKNLASRYQAALRWARTAQFGITSINDFIYQGEAKYRASHRR